LGGMADLAILEVVEVQAGVASEEAPVGEVLELEVLEAVLAEEALVAAVVLEVAPVGEEDSLSNI
jgi:hypothetical protein